MVLQPNEYVSGIITGVFPSANFAHLSHATDPVFPNVRITLTGALAVAATLDNDNELTELGVED